MAQEDLMTYWRRTKHKGFTPMPRYYKYGDYLTYFVKPDRCVSQRVNEFLVVYRSVDNGSLVGCKIKGVARVMKRIKEMHVLVADSELTIGLFIFSTAAITKELGSRDKVLDCAKEIPLANIPMKELATAA